MPIRLTPKTTSGSALSHERALGLSHDAAGNAAHVPRRERRSGLPAGGGTDLRGAVQRRVDAPEPGEDPLRVVALGANRIGMLCIIGFLDAALPFFRMGRPMLPRCFDYAAHLATGHTS